MDVYVFQGGGQYVFWMLGVRDYLNAQWDMSDTTMIGASSGALCVVLTACGVATTKVLTATELIYKKYQPMSRMLGVCGIWSGMVKEWLELLLPDDAHTRCSGRTHIIVSRFRRPPLIVSTFESKQDLIECLMATTHLPFYMNYMPFRTFRGEWCYDGDWSAKSYNDYEILGKENAYHHFDYTKDNSLAYNSVHTHGINIFKNMVRCGYEFAGRNHKLCQKRKRKNI